MKPSLHVQIIRTNWTKQSRGGPLATPRNAVPLAFALEDLHNGYLSVQHISYSEHDAFQSPHIIQKKIELTNDLHYEHGSFTLRWDGQTATTQFKELLWYTCAPGVKSPDPNIGHFIVPPNQWVRLRWQGRFTNFYDGGPWWYEHYCINVTHFGGNENPNIFLQTQPTKQFTHLPQLW